MISSKPIALVALLALGVAVIAPAQDNTANLDRLVRGTETEWENFELSSGLRVTVVHATAAPKQTFFIVIPFGFLADDAGRSQFAHLVEHMVIRSTDPDTLSADGMNLNGETGALSMRLDVSAEPSSWREALVRQRKWLEEWINPTVLDGDVLGREKQNIQKEEEFTTQQGFAHKWADAAWGQVVRHGRTHAAVHGDVAEATVEEIRRYAGAQARSLSGARLVAVGPVDPVALRDAIGEIFGELDLKPVGEPSQRPDAEAVRAVGDRQATWDLDSHHYMEWYPLPDGSVADRVAGLILAQALSMRLLQDADLVQMGARAFVTPDLVTPEGRWLKISASVPADIDLEKLRERLRTNLDPLQGGALAVPALQMMLNQSVLELQTLPDLAELRKQYAAQGVANDFLEANLVLALINAEWIIGASRQEMVEGLRELTAERLRDIAVESLAEKNRSTLRLTPASGGRVPQ